MADFQAARQHMVDSQIRTNKVTDRALLSALAEVPREAFLASHLRAIAYIDEDLDIGGGRYLMEPMVLARMIQALDLEAGDVVLDVGCASGYSSAVLARLATAVVALECDGPLARDATTNFAENGVDNVVVVEDELSHGHGEQAPYQAIFLNGAVPALPETLLGQLADGGRLCAVIHDGAGTGRAVRAVRHGATVAERVLFDANVPPLPGFDRQPGFVF
jgi:protein-L-isoaspartate(D-aspartate) O-methyltransferase